MYSSRYQVIGLWFSNGRMEKFTRIAKEPSTHLKNGATQSTNGRNVGPHTHSHWISASERYRVNIFLVIKLVSLQFFLVSSFNAEFIETDPLVRQLTYSSSLATPRSTWTTPASEPPTRSTQFCSDSSKLAEYLPISRKFTFTF